MKYGQIIKPEDVPSLVRSGELHFGTLLEYRSTNPRTNEYEWSDPLPFYGFNPDNGTFISRGIRGYYAARAPLPALKDGDPVCVLDYDQNWRKYHFKAFGMHNNIECYDSYGTRWSSHGSSTWYKWRLPTRDELRDRGMPDWYDGRIELEEG